MKAASYLFLLSLVVFIFPLACTKTLVAPVSAIPTATPTFTPTATTVVVSGPITISVTSANRYSVNGIAGPAISAPITVVSGQMVNFDSSNGGHPLYIDNGNGICNGTSPQTIFPYLYTISGSPGTMYTFHCGIHGSCGATPSPAICTLPCTGMTGVFHVQ
jgi:hypothetical protein